MHLIKGRCVFGFELPSYIQTEAREITMVEWDLIKGRCMFGFELDYLTFSVGVLSPGMRKFAASPPWFSMSASGTSICTPICASVAPAVAKLRLWTICTN